MKININDLLDSGEPLVISHDGAKITGLALEGKGQGEGEGASEALGFSIPASVSVRLEVRRMDESLFLEGSLKGSCELQCSRCLKDFSFPLSSNFSSLVPLEGEADKKSAKEDDEDEAVEMELAHIEDGELNLTALLLEEITLALPTKPLCDGSCKGLCLTCGTDLNTGRCGCAENIPIDSRLSKLKEFKAR